MKPTLLAAVLAVLASALTAIATPPRSDNAELIREVNELRERFEEMQMADKQYKARTPSGEYRRIQDKELVDCESVTMDSAYPRSGWRELLKCRSIGDLTVVGVAGLHEFWIPPTVKQIRGTVRVLNNPNLGHAHFNRVARIDGPLLIDNNTNMFEIDAAELAHIYGAVHVATDGNRLLLDLPKLRDIGGALRLWATGDRSGPVKLKRAVVIFRVPLLSKVMGTVVMHRSQLLDAAQLAEIRGGLLVEDAPAVWDLTVDNSRRAPIAFPQLQRVAGTLTFRDNHHTHEIALPKLANSPADVVLTGNTLLTAIHTPKMANIGASLFCVGNGQGPCPTFRGLRNIGGRAVLQAPCAGADVHPEAWAAALGTLKFPVSVSGGIIFDNTVPVDESHCKSISSAVQKRVRAPQIVIRRAMPAKGNSIFTHSFAAGALFASKIVRSSVGPLPPLPADSAAFNVGVLDDELGGRSSVMMANTPTASLRAGSPTKPSAAQVLRQPGHLDSDEMASNASQQTPSADPVVVLELPPAQESASVICGPSLGAAIAAAAAVVFSHAAFPFH